MSPCIARASTAAPPQFRHVWTCVATVCPTDVLEGKGPQKRPQKQLDRRLEEVAKRVGAVRLLSVTNAIEVGICR
jgi:hypothetical protein